MKTVLVAFYNVPGYGLDSVETVMVGNAQEEYSTLNQLVRDRHPSARGEFRRVGSVIEQRNDDGSDDFVSLSPGVTLGQLFNDYDQRKLGRTFFNGSPYDIVLNRHVAQGVITFTLRAVLRRDGDIRLPHTLSPLRLVSELPELVEEILGGNGRDTKLNFREAKPQPAI